MNEIKSVIIAAYPVYNRPGRFVMRDRILNTDMNGTLILKIISDEMIESYGNGRNKLYNFELTYYEQYQPAINYNRLSERATELMGVIDANRTGTYWRYITADIFYELEDFHGFKLDIKAYWGVF